MQTNQPLISQDRTAAFAAVFLPWLAWLQHFALKLGTPRRSRGLSRRVRSDERPCENIVFLMAVARVRAPRRGARRPASIPAAFKRTHPHLRRFNRHGRIRLRRASLVDRLQRLVDAMAAPERYIERYIPTLRRGICRPRLTLIAAVAETARTLPRPASPLSTVRDLTNGFARTL